MDKLVVEEVSKAFRVQRDGGREDVLQVLRNVSFSLPPGKIVSIIGESGCGKTTLLRIVQGLIALDSGRILVDEKPVDRPDWDRGFVFQHATLLPWRTAKANVAFGLEIQGVARGERDRIARELLDLVGLKGAYNQYPHQLSGGMQQRVGLARAMAISPAILLMDEPFSALDAQTREVLQRELMRIHGETGQTVLFVTHDLDEAIYLSDRVVMLAANPGRVKEVIDIPFERPRAELPVLRSRPEFAEIRMRMWDLIRRPDA